MIADIVGVGVLSLGEAVAQLGWGLGAFMLIAMFPLNVCTGIMLWRAHFVYPSSVTYSGLVKKALGKKVSKIFSLLWYVYIFSFLGDFLLSSGKTLGMIFYDKRICLPTWSAIAAFGMIIPLHQLRTLSSLSGVVLINVVTITMALLITLGYLWSQGSAPMNDEAASKMMWQTVGTTTAIDPSISFNAFFRASATMLFAYSGQFLYVEMMAEMVEPEKFPRAFLYTGPYQVGVYAAVAFTGYAYIGSDVSGFITNVLPFGSLYRSSAFFLFLHMIVTYLVKGTVVARALHYQIDKARINDTDLTSRFEYFSITLIVMICAYLLAMVIPFFDLLTALIGSLFSPVICFIIPCLIYMKAMKAQGMKLTSIQMAGIFMLVTFAVMILIFGTWGTIASIIYENKSMGGMFACGCDSMWNSVTACCANIAAGEYHSNVSACCYDLAAHPEVDC